MVSATIHLANRDWDSLVDDFVALGFLPASIDRGVVIPVMDRVLSPYLKGGGARAFNFQVVVVVAMHASGSAHDAFLSTHGGAFLSVIQVVCVMWSMMARAAASTSPLHRR